MQSYQNMSDEELIAALRSGEKEITDYLMDKYKSLVKKKAKALYLIGGETDDLIQEGMIGLFKAVRDYRPQKNASFSTFANLCVERQMYKAIEMSARQKHKPLNSYISLSEEDSPLKNTEDVLQQNPETIVIGRENASHLMGHIKEALSPFENQVLETYLKGMDYVQIAELMGKSPKSIDNALQRIRNKLQSLK